MTTRLSDDGVTYSSACISQRHETMVFLESFWAVARRSPLRTSMFGSLWIGAKSLTRSLRRAVRVEAPVLQGTSDSMEPPSGLPCIGLRTKYGARSVPNKKATNTALSTGTFMSSRRSGGESQKCARTWSIQRVRSIKLTPFTPPEFSSSPNTQSTHSPPAALQWPAS